MCWRILCNVKWPAALCADLFLRNSSGNVTRNVEITDRNPLTFACNVWISLCRYSRSPQSRSVFLWTPPVTNFIKTHKKKAENSANVLLTSSSKVYHSLHRHSLHRLSLNLNIVTGIAEYNQQDEKFHNLFISVRRCTCFRRFFRPSSGAQNCTYSVRYLSHQYPTLYLQFWAPDDRRNTRLKHIERLTEINKLWNVASFWLYSANILAMHGPMNVKLSLELHGRNFHLISPKSTKKYELFKCKLIYTLKLIMAVTEPFGHETHAYSTDCFQRRPTPNIKKKNATECLIADTRSTQTDGLMDLLLVVYPVYI